MASSRSPIAGNLPHEVTGLIGRDVALEQIRRALADTRLLTLVGMGGVGKTRLALRAARDVCRAFREGAWFVELGSIRDPDLVPSMVAGALGVEGIGGSPALPALAQTLAPRQTLIVLDNCEHLIASCAALASALMRHCPGVRILATSREPLAVDGEQVMYVPALAVPPSDENLTLVAASEYPAFELFIERVASVNPQFHLTDDKFDPIADICRMLDGVPLALELAATKLRVLSPVQLRDRLNDRLDLLVTGHREAAARQQTLRSVIDWSHDLCSPEEQLLWARLSVFRGSFDLGAAEAVCFGDALAPEDVVHALSGLVMKSILMTSEESDVVEYFLSETLRDYGAEHLSQDERDILRCRLVGWYAAVVSDAASQWFTARQVQTLWSLRREHSNLRAAMEYSLEAADQVEVGLTIAASLRYYWSISGYLAEGAHWLDRLLAVYAQRDRARLSGLRVRATIATAMGDTTMADDALAEADALASDLQEFKEQGAVLQLRGVVAVFRGDPVLGAELLERAYALHKDLGDESAWTHDAVMWALAAFWAGAAERANSLLVEALDVSRARGASWTTALALFASGIVALESSNAAEAIDLERESLRMRLQLDDRRNTGLNLETLAWCATAEGDPERAAVLFGAAQSVEDKVGAPLEEWRPLYELHLAYSRSAREALGAGKFQRHFESGRVLPLSDAVAFALGDDRQDVGQLRPALVKPPAAGSGLTRREQEVADLVAEGLTNREIAARLVLSVRTVEVHVEHLREKLGVRSRTQVALWVQRQAT